MIDELPWTPELRAALGTPSRVRRRSSSPHSRVWQARLSTGPAIVKQLLAEAETDAETDDKTDADAGYHREVTALRLAGKATPAVVPQVLGVDERLRVLVLEHVAGRRPRRTWVLDWAAGLAGVHAALGKAEDSEAVDLPTWTGPGDADVDAFLRLASKLGVAAGDAERGELRAVVGRLDAVERPALLHGDPCPGNDLYPADGVRFVDFEQAAIGNGLVELAYLRISFPTCWCVTDVDAALLAEAEGRYREVWRAATGSEPAGDLTDACIGWLIRGDALVQKAFRDSGDHFQRLLVEDWDWGTVSARERLAYRLGVVAELVADRADLAGVRRVCTAMCAELLRRWPKLAAPPRRRPKS